jgi:hypothetical protein
VVSTATKERFITQTRAIEMLPDTNMNAASKVVTESSYTTSVIDKAAR